MRIWLARLYRTRAALRHSWQQGALRRKLRSCNVKVSVLVAYGINLGSIVTMAGCATMMTADHSVPNPTNGPAWTDRKPTNQQSPQLAKTKEKLEEAAQASTKTVTANKPKPFEFERASKSAEKKMTATKMPRSVSEATGLAKTTVHADAPIVPTEKTAEPAAKTVTAAAAAPTKKIPTAKSPNLDQWLSGIPKVDASPPKSAKDLLLSDAAQAPEKQASESAKPAVEPAKIVADAESKPNDGKVQLSVKTSISRPMSPDEAEVVAKTEAAAPMPEPVSTKPKASAPAVTLASAKADPDEQPEVKPAVNAEPVAAPPAVQRVAATTPAVPEPPMPAPEPTVAPAEPTVAKSEAPAPKALPEAPKTPAVETPKSIHGHADDYTWVQGIIDRIHSRRCWEVRYASLEQADEFGGRFILEGQLPAGVKTGDVVRLSGRPAPTQSGRSNEMVYRYTECQRLGTADSIGPGLE